MVSPGGATGVAYQESSLSTRLAVVGAGVMGANHIRVAKSQAIVELVAIVDGDTERAQAARGDDTHIECFTNVDDLIASEPRRGRDCRNPRRPSTTRWSRSA